jgi:plastocyanin
MHQPVAPRAARVASAVLAAVALLGAGVPAASAATVTVHIRDTLDPKSLTIAPGTAVRWVNDSDNRYRMRSRSGPVEFDSGNLEPGESYTFMFQVGGTYPYVDDRERDDPAFHGTITVRAGSVPAATPPPGGGGGTPSPGLASGTVHMAGRAFSPSGLTIAAGGSVTFLNDDDDEHTATGSAFDTGVLNPGTSSRKTFAAAGSFSFLCAIHPEMRGTITVRAASGSGAGGGDGAPAAPPAPTPTARPTATPAASAVPAQPGTAQASIVDFAFDPLALRIKAGTTVRWRNDGAAPHTVTADDGSFDSGLIAAGASFERTFGEAGAVAYVCTFHPGMVGTVEVVAPGSGAGPGTAPTASPPTSSAPSSSSSAAPSPPAADGGAVTGDPPPGDGVAGPAAEAPDTAAASSGSGPFGALLALAMVVVAIAVFGWLILATMRPPQPSVRRGR